MLEAITYQDILNYIVADLMSCHRLAFSARKSVIGQAEKSATLYKKQ